MSMNRKQRKTLQAVFETPTRTDLEWNRVESMLRALGAEIREARGSRILVKLHGRKAVFHRPHPKKELHKGAVNSLREFLRNAGVKP